MAQSHAPCGLFAPRFIDSDGTLICGTRARTRMPPGIAPAPLSRIWYRSIRVVFFVDRPHLISLTVTAHTQIAYTMAATTRTPAVSIKISAISRPAIFALSTWVPPLQICTRSFTSVPRSINSRSGRVEVAIERNREDARKHYKLMKCSGQRNAHAQDLRHG